MAVGRRAAMSAGSLAAAVLVLVPLAAAFACGPLASLRLAVGEAAPGDVVAGTGKDFSTSHGGAPSPEPVVVHFGSPTGAVLWSGRPTTDGAVTFTFTVPAAAPEQYQVVTTQTNADGEPAPGTPAPAPAGPGRPVPVAGSTWFPCRSGYQKGTGGQEGAIASCNGSIEQADFFAIIPEVAISG